MLQGMARLILHDMPHKVIRKLWLLWPALAQSRLSHDDDDDDGDDDDDADDDEDDDDDDADGGDDDVVMHDDGM